MLASLGVKKYKDFKKKVLVIMSKTSIVCKAYLKNCCKTFHKTVTLEVRRSCANWGHVLIGVMCKVLLKGMMDVLKINRQI